MLAGFISGFACGVIVMAYYFKYQLKKLAEQESKDE
jgi:hypothetical protein